MAEVAVVSHMDQSRRDWGASGGIILSPTRGGKTKKQEMNFRFLFCSIN